MAVPHPHFILTLTSPSPPLEADLCVNLFLLMSIMHSWKAHISLLGMNNSILICFERVIKSHK